MGDLFNSAARPAIDWVAIAVAGGAGFVVGGLWYSKLLFAKAWMEATGMTEARAKSGNVGLIMVSAFALTVLISYCIARLSLRGGDWQAGAKIGLFVGSAIVCANGVNMLFEMRPFKLWLIHSGHQLVSCVLIGAILAAWH